MGALNNLEYWCFVNEQLVAKALSELDFEEALTAQPLGDGCYELRLQSGVVYSFVGRRNAWDHLMVKPGSVSRHARDGRSCDARQLMVDAAVDLGLRPGDLGMYLEELAQTLSADMQIAASQEGRSADDLLDLPHEVRQSYLFGHPKGIPSKGRLGWSREDFERYAPEARAPFQLVWLAVRQDLCVMGRAAGVDARQLVSWSMDEATASAFWKDWQAANLSLETHTVLPVHPWQWDHVVQSQFAAELASGDLVYLGTRGDRYQPLISLRTLANVTRPGMAQLKLPISILNTSCYRGLPARYIEVAASLSAWLSHVCGADDVLASRDTRVLWEPAGTACLQRHYAQVPEVPYRYRELLGAVWRESLQAQLGEDEQAILAGALTHRDPSEQSLLAAAIKRSGASAETWVQAYCDNVVVPLYHLLCKYGVGLVAHGQNVTVILEKGLPKRLVIKDLQGDLRLLDQDLPEMAELPDTVRKVLPRLPAPYLIHDLQTGHFVSVIRFMAFELDEARLLPERDFYRILSQVLLRYQEANRHLKQRFEMFNLMEAEMPRVCVNRVRFRDGYGEDGQRPEAVLGTPLRNPLHVAAEACVEEF